jgi:DNA-binding NarL/FixJ family response regulator
VRITSASINPASRTPAPLRILVVDDDAFFRRGLREILNEAEGVQVVGEASDGAQALALAGELCAEDGVDLVLTDLALPRIDGLAMTSRLLEAHPNLGVVVLTLSTADSDLVDAVRAGVVGYLSKHLGPEALVSALLAFHRGESLPMSRAIGLRVLDLARHAAGLGERVEAALPQLTSREADVLDLVASGARDRDIAERLVVSESTVKKHLQNILRKFHARNRAEAVARWRSRGSG